MHHHPRRLVHHEHIVIFIDDVERNILRDEVHAAAPVGHHEADHVSGTHEKIGLRRLLPHLNISLLDCTLDAMARSVFEVSRHELVDADGHLPCIDVQTEMFEHSLFFVFNFDYFVFVPVHRFLRAQSEPPVGLF